MAQVISQQLKALDRFKNLIVESIKDTKDFFNDLKYENYRNSVSMLDCLLESYKKDPQFETKAKEILTVFKIKQFSNLTLQLIDQELGDEYDIQNKNKLYQSWFRLLIDLANRTIFSGRMMDVDVNMEDIMSTWQDMVGTSKKDIEDEAESKSVTDHTNDEDDEEEPEVEDIEIEPIV